jgi:hypothetical protein
MMKAMKIRIESPTHCKYIQDALFEAGYGWQTVTPKSHYEPCTKTAAWIFAYDDGSLTWDHEEDYGTSHPLEEYVWTPQKSFMKAADYYKQPETPPIIESPPLGLKPKKLHDKQRLIEIINAMYRYVSTDNVIPAEWFAEAQYLNGQMEK